MDPDTLKELLTAFRELGAEAKGAFVWYLFFAYLSSILWTFGGIGLLWGLLRLLHRILWEVSWGRAIADACGHHGEWYVFERKQVVDCLSEHYSKEKNKDE